MKEVKLQNEHIRAVIALAGAELTELADNKTGREYLWYGDKKYWGRRSPVLFPLVGSLKDKKYRYDGREYEMGQHGFARDKEFTLQTASENEAWFALWDDEETREKYPFSFRLEIGYRLAGRELTVLWRVSNTDKKPLYFSIGGHPAFLVPEKKEEHYLNFHTGEQLTCTGIVNGLAEGLHTVYPVLQAKDGCIRLEKTLFDQDALVFENSQLTEIGLAAPDKKEYLSVRFDAPVVGVWSPCADAPFVCIEPWYGRCDALHFNGTLEEREWGNCIQPKEVFEARYTICLK